MYGDDDDFTPGASSNLATLFNKTKFESGNPSLTYTAPKQPKTSGSLKTKVSTATSTSNTFDLLLVKTVQSFKLEGGSFHAQAKAGAAVLGNADTKYYQILVYRDKHNHLCSAKITQQFKFMVQARNYATFYDKNKCVWSVLFDADEDLVAFGMEVALAKWNSEENPNLTVQDLWVPEVMEEEKADYGHTVHFTYTAFSIELYKLGKEQGDGTVKTAQVSKSGWEQGLLGVFRNMQRIIIIPSSQLGVWKSLVGNDSPIAIKLTVTRVYTGKGEEKPVDSDLLTYDSSSGEGNVKARGASIKEALTCSPKAAKANLISRMAKMGQALPFKGAVPTPSDSDETEEDQNVKIDGEVRTVPPRPRVRATNQVMTHTTSSVVTQPPATWFPQHPYMVGGMYPQIQSPVDPQLPVFFSEVRTHNSELRMGITRVTDKIDFVINKLDHLNQSKPISNVESTVLENMNLMSEENLFLRKELESKLSLVQSQNDQLLKLLSESALAREKEVPITSGNKVEDINKDINESKKCVVHKEKIALLENENLALTQKYEETLRRLKLVEERLESAEQISETHIKNSSVREEEREKLKFILEAQRVRIESLEKEGESSSNQIAAINDLKEKLTKYNEEVEALNIQLKQRDKLIENLDKSVKEKHDVIQQLSTTVDRRTVEKQKLEDQISEIRSQNGSKAYIADEIKYVMNHVYRMLKAQFMSQVSYTCIDIQNILAETIKNATVQYLQQSSGSPLPSAVAAANYIPIRDNFRVVSSPAPDVRTQSPKLEKVKEENISQNVIPAVGAALPVNIGNQETQVNGSVPHTAFGEYKNSQQRQEMEKEQMRKLSQQSVSSKGLNDKKVSDISLSSDKDISSEGNLADKESSEDTIAAQIETNVSETTKSSQEEKSKQNLNVCEISLPPQTETNDDSADDIWRPQPPPPPLFDEDENEDDWLNT